MKKIISALFAFVLFCMVSSLSVFASTFEASHEQLTLADGNSAVSITVKSVPGDEISITVAASNAPEIFVYANQKTVNEQGIATFIFKTGDGFTEGKYYYNVYSNETGSVLDPVPVFEYYSSESINQTFADLYALRLLEDEAEKVEKAYELIDENSEKLRVQTPLYLKLAEREIVPEKALLSVLEKQYTFDEIDDFAGVFYDNLCVDVIIHLRDYDDMLLLYGDSGELSIVQNIGLGTTGTEQDLKRYERFTEMDNDTKKQVFKEIDAINPDSVETFKNAFSQAVFMTELNNAVNWDMIDELIINHSELIDSSSEYIALDNSKKSAEICQELFSLVSKGYFTSVSDFSSKLDELINSDEPIDDEKPTIITGRPSGGGGGGGGGGTPTKVEVPKQPEKPVEPTQQEEVKPEKINSFEDIADVTWAKDAIDVLYAKGVISGRSETVFAPNDNVTREEFVKMACELFGFTNTQAMCNFEDVNPENWFYIYVASAQEKGLVNGISETEFGSGALLTREDLVTLAYRFAVAANIDFDNEAHYIPFNDHDLVADYAKEALQVLAKCEVIGGKDGNMFYPEDYCTRAETAKILYGIYKNLY